MTTEYDKAPSLSARITWLTLVEKKGKPVCYREVAKLRLPEGWTYKRTLKECHSLLTVTRKNETDPTTYVGFILKFRSRYGERYTEYIVKDMKHNVSIHKSRKQPRDEEGDE